MGTYGDAQVCRPVTLLLYLFGPQFLQLYNMEAVFSQRFVREPLLCKTQTELLLRYSLEPYG